MHTKGKKNIQWKQMNYEKLSCFKTFLHFFEGRGVTRALK